MLLQRAALSQGGARRSFQLFIGRAAARPPPLIDGIAVAAHKRGALRLFSTRCTRVDAPALARTPPVNGNPVQGRTRPRRHCPRKRRPAACSLCRRPQWRRILCPRLLLCAHQANGRARRRKDHQYICRAALAPSSRASMARARSSDHRRRVRAARVPRRFPGLLARAARADGRSARDQRCSALFVAS